jgi:hypothetical protein
LLTYEWHLLNGEKRHSKIKKMYYEEKDINGTRHFRRTPTGEWQILTAPEPATIDELLHRKELQIQWLTEVIEATRARIQGEWDNPSLQKFSKATPDKDADILGYIESLGI